MNIFLPYEYNLEKSAETLDDRRLIKQILELYLILRISLGYNSRYKSHPIVEYYNKYPKFLALYGYICCQEYTYRFRKEHKCMKYFIQNKDIAASYTPVYLINKIIDKKYIYMPKLNMESVSKKYQRLLKWKWGMDRQKKHSPRWTNRDIPYIFNENFNII